MESKQITEQIDMFEEVEEEFTWEGVWQDGETWGIAGGLFVFFALMIIW